MKASFNHLSAWLLIAMISGAAGAQEGDNATDYHPFLTDKFHLGIGGFWPQKSLQIQVNGNLPTEEIDFEEDLGFDESESTTSLNFRWRYSKNWSLWAQYWAVDSEAGAILNEDIEWQDVIFKAGSFASSGSDVSITRIFFGRSIIRKPGHEFGAGAGIHWIQIEAFIEGQIISGATTEFHRESVKSSLPLPNIGAWYMYSWSPKWLVDARLDWLSASIDNYSGGLWHAQAGIHYQISRTFGVGLAYSNFILDVDVDEDDWRGAIETRQNGPRLELTASW